MTRHDTILQLQRIQSELLRDIDELESVATAINAKNTGALLLTNYIVPHLRYLVNDEDEYSQLLPNLNDAIAGVRARKPK